MRSGKLVMIIGLILMSYGLYNGFVNGNFMEDGKVLMANPWGVMSLIDIYVSMLIFAAWIIFREMRLVPSVFWILLLIVLGSFGACLYCLIAMMKAKDDWMTFFLGRRRNNQVDQW